MYDFHWLDPDKEVYVLQNRKFRKKGKLHFNVGGGITTSGAFVDTAVFQGRIGYFAREEWGFEYLYSKNNGKENSTARSVRNDGGSGSVPFRRIITNYTGGMVLWSPFYNKINTFNSIIYSDWIIGLGYAQLEHEHNGIELKDGDKQETVVSHNGIIWNLGNKIYLAENFNVRVDLTTIHYRAKRISTKPDREKKIWYSNWDIALSFGYRF